MIKPLKQEIMDQALHMLSACLFMLAFVLPIPLWGAAILTMLVAFIRELEQHHWNWRIVGRRDLYFWALGTVIFSLSYIGV